METVGLLSQCRKKMQKLTGRLTISGRLPYLQKGILGQLAQATKGIGVVLEHRYYGASIPTPDMSTENLRFLTTDQALADTAFFAENVVFEGLADLDLTAPNVPYIAYGGSYAGAFVVGSILHRDNIR